MSHISNEYISLEIFPLHFPANSLWGLSPMCWLLAPAYFIRVLQAPNALKPWERRLNKVMKPATP